MEARVFTPDSRRLLLHRCAYPHGFDKTDPRHAYLLCDLENGGRLHPITEEPAATSPSVAPDGKCVYYFVDETRLGGGRLSLKRVNIDGTERRTVMVIDGPLPGSRFRPSRIYPLSTISSDGKRLALQAFLGDGRTRSAPFGLLVFDLEQATVSLPIYGPSLCNMHAQFSRSKDPDKSHDIMIQENHGYICNAEGAMIHKEPDAGVDVHVIRDDGTNLRDLPWGLDGREFCTGHECWRGRSDWGITSVSSVYGSSQVEKGDYRLIESKAVAHQGHRGSQSWWAKRNELSAGFDQPRFNHFATDEKGDLLITDKGADVYLAFLEEPASGPARAFVFLLCSGRLNRGRAVHDIHPFLSPDGALGFFNSDESGIPQAYMIRGLPSIAT